MHEPQIHWHYEELKDFELNHLRAYQNPSVDKLQTPKTPQSNMETTVKYKAEEQRQKLQKESDKRLKEQRNGQSLGFWKHGAAIT